MPWYMQMAYMMEASKAMYTEYRCWDKDAKKLLIVEDYCLGFFTSAANIDNVSLRTGILKY